MEDFLQHRRAGQPELIVGTLHSRMPAQQGVDLIPAQDVLRRLAKGRQNAEQLVLLRRAEELGGNQHVPFRPEPLNFFPLRFRRGAQSGKRGVGIVLALHDHRPAGIRCVPQINALIPPPAKALDPPSQLLAHQIADQQLEIIVGQRFEIIFHSPRPLPPAVRSERQFFPA